VTTAEPGDNLATAGKGKGHNEEAWGHEVMVSPVDGMLNGHSTTRMA
jgi:hypothetical protein